MTRTTWYYTLMASLPPLPDLFSGKPLPISRIQLNRRLSMLSSEDAAELSAIEDIMHWDRFPLEITDSEIVKNANDVIPHIRNAVLRNVVIGRLERRTIVAALRRRALGLPQPERGELWGYGRWVRRVETNWHDPDFGLAHIIPWLPVLRQLMEHGDPSGVERASLQRVWHHLSRAAEGYYFDYVAVVFYVLRWGVFARLRSFDSKLAVARVDNLVEEGLRDYADLFAEDEAGSLEVSGV